MTTIQAIHHVEQMQAARAEFAEFWKTESQRPYLQRLGRLGNPALIEHEITAWNAFLKGRGLK